MQTDWEHLLYSIQMYPVELSEKKQRNVLKQDLGFAYMLILPQEIEYVSS